MRTRWLVALMMMVLGVAATAQMRPRKHDAKRPGVDRHGFLPVRRDHFKRDGRLIFVENDKAREVRKEWLKKPHEERAQILIDAGMVRVQPLALDGIKGAQRLGMKRRQGHFYQFFEVEGVTWHEAKAKCEEMGGHLATIDSREENRAISGTLSQMTNRAWIGASNTKSTGRWAWVKSSEMWRYRYWVSGRKIGKNDVKRILRARAVRRKLLGRAAEKRAELVVEAEGKAAKYLAGAKKSNNVTRNVMKAVVMGAKLIDKANERADLIELDAREHGARVLIEAHKLKYREALNQKREDKVAAMEALIATSDKAYLNNRVGNYMYMIRGGRWNARFADGGWLEKGDTDGNSINGFVCEWDDEKDIRWAHGERVGEKAGPEVRVYVEGARGRSARRKFRIEVVRDKTANGVPIKNAKATRRASGTKRRTSGGRPAKGRPRGSRSTSRSCGRGRRGARPGGSSGTRGPR